MEEVNKHCINDCLEEDQNPSPGHSLDNIEVPMKLKQSESPPTIQQSMKLKEVQESELVVSEVPLSPISSLSPPSKSKKKKRSSLASKNNNSHQSF